MKDPKTGREMNNNKRRRNAVTQARIDERRAIEAQFRSARPPLMSGDLDTPSGHAAAHGTVYRELRLSP